MRFEATIIFNSVSVFHNKCILVGTDVVLRNTTKQFVLFYRKKCLFVATINDYSSLWKQPKCLVFPSVRCSLHGAGQAIQGMEPVNLGGQSPSRQLSPRFVEPSDSTMLPSTWLLHMSANL